MSHLHPIRTSALVPGATRGAALQNSAPPILHRQYTRLDGPARHRIIHGARPLVIVIGAACTWLAVFCIVYFAVELARGLR